MRESSAGKLLRRFAIPALAVNVLFSLHSSPELPAQLQVRSARGSEDLADRTFAWADQAGSVTERAVIRAVQGRINTQGNEAIAQRAAVMINQTGDTTVAAAARALQKQTSRPEDIAGRALDWTNQAGQTIEAATAKALQESRR